jgi:hypothetical protein
MFNQLTRCNFFGHRYTYYFTQDSPIRNFRFCSRCKVVEELTDKYKPAFNKNWFALVSYTPFGAKETLGDFYNKN